MRCPVRCRCVRDRKWGVWQQSQPSPAQARGVRKALDRWAESGTESGMGKQASSRLKPSTHHCADVQSSPVQSVPVGYSVLRMDVLDSSTKPWESTMHHRLSTRRCAANHSVPKQIKHVGAKCNEHKERLDRIDTRNRNQEQEKRKTRNPVRDSITQTPAPLNTSSHGPDNNACSAQTPSMGPLFDVMWGQRRAKPTGTSATNAGSVARAGPAGGRDTVQSARHKTLYGDGIKTQTWQRSRGIQEGQHTAHSRDHTLFYWYHYKGSQGNT